MSKLFGFCGRKRSGKTTLSQVVKEEYDGVILTVANYLKYICCDILSCSLDELNRKKDDGTVFSIIPDEHWFEIIHKATNIDINLIKEDIGNVVFTDIRQMLQVIGTDCIRKHNPNWHVDCLVKDIKRNLSDGNIIAVDDVRFPNERKAIEELGGECFFIVRPLTKNISNHSSELALTWDMFDNEHVIINDDSLLTLANNFRQHIKNHFAIDNTIPIFQCEKLRLCLMNNLFGKEKTDLVEKVLEQNKDYDGFRDGGIFLFKASTAEEMEEFMTSIYGVDVKYNKEFCHNYRKVYNPLIIENFKKWL